MRCAIAHLVCVTVTCSVGLIAAPSALAAKPFGLNDLPGEYGAKAGRVLTLHARLGSRVQRIGFPWRRVQPRPGGFDWSYPDQMVKVGRKGGLRTLAVVTTAPDWAAAPTLSNECFLRRDAPRCQRPPAREHLGAFRRYVAAIATRYRDRLVAIEIYNEPNFGGLNWQPAADPEYYAEVLRAAHTAVKAVTPNLPVISGGVSPPPFPIPDGTLDPFVFLERMYAAGARGAMDGIGVHPYPGRRAPHDTSAEGYLAFMRRVRAIRDAAGDAATPLWVTEFGYTTAGEVAVTRARQARWLPRLVATAMLDRDVRAVIVHTLADRGREAADAEAGFGLTDSALRPKPAFSALARRLKQIAICFPSKPGQRRSRAYERRRKRVCGRQSTLRPWRAAPRLSG